MHTKNAAADGFNFIALNNHNPDRKPTLIGLPLPVPRTHGRIEISKSANKRLLLLLSII